MKHYITKKSQIGKQGAGQYIIQDDNKKVLKCVTYTGTETKVDESQKSLTDIHTLLEPAIKNGLLRHSTKFTDQYDDIPHLDFQEALETVAKAGEMFDALPSKIRNRFQNDPKQFLEFTQNPSNAEEMRSLGMLKGNDGFTSTGAPSGAPTKTDMDGDGIKDAPPE